MDDEKLIECVRECPVLYDMTHPKYLDSDYKTGAWKRVAEILAVQDAMSCKKRWVNIRDQFKKSLNRRKTRSGQAAGSVVKKYKYEEVLQFLLPHIQERDTLTNLDPPSLDDQPVDSQSVAHNESEGTPDEINDGDQENNLTADGGNITSAAAIENKRKKRRVEKTPQTESASAVLMRYIVESKKIQEDKHPMDVFLDSLSPILKKMSSYRQHLARGRIFSVVQQLEAEEMFGAQNLSAPHVTTCNSTPMPYSSASSNDDSPHSMTQNNDHDSQFINPLSFVYENQRH